MVIEDTDLAGNELYDVYVRHVSRTRDYAWPGLWWGSANASAIAAAIFDCDGNPAEGCVAFEPAAVAAIIVGECSETPMEPGTWGGKAIFGGAESRVLPGRAWESPHRGDGW